MSAKKVLGKTYINCSYIYGYLDQSLVIKDLTDNEIIILKKYLKILYENISKENQLKILYLN